jgi:hypothetical protein
MSRYQTPEFLELKEKWDKILKDDGFIDIEAADTPDTSAPFHKKSGKNAHTALWLKSKIDYFTYATYFLNEHKFETENQRIIWEYHTNGVSARNIAKTFNAVGIKSSRMSIWRTINYLRTLMKSKYLSNG